MGDWFRPVDRPSWLEPSALWPRAGHRRGMPVRGYPLARQFPIALIGEGPGRDESQYGYPFVGASGQEVDRHLARVGLSRELCLVTNYSWQVPPEKGDLGALNPHLIDELLRAEPAIIMTLGRHSTRHFLGEVDMEAVHGQPYAWDSINACAFDRPPIILPGFHPAAGMHQVELSAHVAYDFDALAATFAGDLAPRVGSADQWPEPKYYDWTDDKPPVPAVFGWKRLFDSIDDGDEDRPVQGGVAIDTEGSVARPWGLSFTGRPGEAFVVRRGAGERVLRLLGEAMRKYRPLIWLHNSMHDLPVLQAMGIDLVEWGVPFLDTMVLAYHLCVEPQGLKALAFRHCGMRMDSYLDLVGPYTHDRAMDYLLRVATDPLPFPRRPAYVDFEVKNRTQTPKLHTPTAINKRALKIVQDVSAGKVNKDGELTDPYARWYKVEPEDRAIAEARYGVLEAATLDDVPLPIAVRYSARDADATRRIGPGLLARHEAVFGRAA